MLIGLITPIYYAKVTLQVLKMRTSILFFKACFEYYFDSKCKFKMNFVPKMVY